MDSLTRHTELGLDVSVEGWSYGLAGGSWSKRFGISKSLSNSVTYTPYRIQSHQKLISLGQQATTRMDAVKHSIDPGYFMDFSEETSEILMDKSQIGLRGQLVAFLPEPTSNTASLNRANDLALGQFASAVNSAVTQFQSATFVGELSEAIHMVRHPAQSLLRGVHQYLGGLRKVTAGTKPFTKARNKAIAGSWLEYSYGWAPLVSDIKNAAHALSEVTTYRLPRKSVSGRGTDSGPKGGGRGSEVYGPIRRDVYWETTSTVEVRIYGQVCTRTDPLSAGLQSFGLSSFTGFIPQIYELIPYSFLVDYFTNIGQIVYAASNPWTQVTWVNRGILSRDGSRVIDTQGSYTPSHNPAYHVTSDAHTRGISGSWFVERRSRDAYQGSYIPSLRFKLPGFGLKWLNLAALASTHQSAISGLLR